MNIIRPSELNRLKHCPESFWLSIGQPELPDSGAESGTETHAALAMYFRGEQRAFAMPDGQEETLERCLDAFGKYTEALPLADAYIVEGEFELPLGDDWVLRGHPDLVALHGTEAVLPDWKTMYGEYPDPAENLQLGAYGLLHAASDPKTQVYHLGLIQPNVKGGIRWARFERAELSRFWFEILAIVEAVKAAKHATPNPTPGDHCTYCRAQSSCPAVKRDMVKLDKMAFSVPTWAMYSAADKLQAYDLASRLMKACGVIHALCKADLEANPSAFGGELTLKPGATKATITDPAGLFRSLSRVGVTAEDFLGAVSVAKTKLKPVVKAKTGGKGKAFDDSFDEMLRPYVEEKQNSPSLERRKP